MSDFGYSQFYNRFFTVYTKPDFGLRSNLKFTPNMSGNRMVSGKIQFRKVNKPRPYKKLTLAGVLVKGSLGLQKFGKNLCR